MATVVEPTVAQIGETAGAVWHMLAEQGPLSTAKIVKQLDLPRDVVMLAIGWLAREDKINIEMNRSAVVSLR
ncbi:MAG: winged helix-turn-helix domain-containing protein [Planctomycetes bacterium]|nr:winged helix-turn-helix domain-containing protein [Planctomycetota bacterium]